MSRNSRPGSLSSTLSSTSSTRSYLPSIPTTMSIDIPEERSYTTMLHQAEIVYDQLLAERQKKIEDRLDEKKRMFHDKYEQLITTDYEKAQEFQRWSDAALLKIEERYADELRQLREDYESKFVRLKISLEESLMTQMKSDAAAIHAHPASVAAANPTLLNC